jgi:hypothetical protein
LVSGSGTFYNRYLGCFGQSNKLLESFQGIDNYLINVDKELCSINCPCYFSNPVAYSANITVAPYYTQWTKTFNQNTGINVNVNTNINTGVVGSGYATKFQECNTNVQSQVYTNYKAASQNTKYTIKDTKLFMDYYGRIEKQWKCSGFCTTMYYNPSTMTNMVMWKYAFYGIENGPPFHLGCMNELAKTLPQALIAFGIVALIAALFITWCVILAFSLCYTQRNERGSGGEKKGPSQQ